MSSNIEKIKKLEQLISKEITFISRIVRTTLQVNKSNMNEETIIFFNHDRIQRVVGRHQNQIHKINKQI